MTQPERLAEAGADTGSLCVTRLSWIHGLVWKLEPFPVCITCLLLILTTKLTLILRNKLVIPGERFISDAFMHSPRGHDPTLEATTSLCFKRKRLGFILVVFLSGARADGPDHRAAGRGLPEEEPRHPAGPPDPLAQREHRHSDQRVGAQREGGAKDPQRSQSADQV